MTNDTMTAKEFVSNIISDKAFLMKACELIPEELLQEETPEGQEKQPGGLGALMFKYLWPAAQSLGCTFSEDDLHKAVESFQSKQRRYGKTEAQIEEEEKKRG